MALEARARIVEEAEANDGVPTREEHEREQGLIAKMLHDRYEDPLMVESFPRRLASPFQLGRDGIVLRRRVCLPVPGPEGAIFQRMMRQKVVHRILLLANSLPLIREHFSLNK